jgi:hypothetical protein
MLGVLLIIEPYAEMDFGAWSSIKMKRILGCFAWDKVRKGSSAMLSYQNQE